MTSNLALSFVATIAVAPVACRTTNPPPPDWAERKDCAADVSEGSDCEHDGMTCRPTDPASCGGSNYFCEQGKWRYTSPPCNPPRAE